MARQWSLFRIIVDLLPGGSGTTITHITQNSTTLEQNSAQKLRKQ
jgi:hypothetical protein